MKSTMGKYALMAMALAMMAGDKSVFSETPKPSEMPDVQLSDEEKERVKRKYESQFHIYNVNGEQIKARSKKDARIIYQRNHKKTKK